MAEAKCAKCGSERVIPRAPIVDQMHKAATVIVVYGAPEAMMFKDANYGELRADLCCDCGNVEIRCEGNLNWLWNAYVAAGKKQ